MNPAAMTPEALAPLAALAAAAAFGAGVQAQGRAVREMDAVAGALIGVTVATLIFAAAAPFAVRPEWVFSEATLWFALCGLFMPALSMILAIRSVGLAGPALTASLGAVSPFFAVAPAVLLLGESIGPQAVAGLLLMTGGLAVSPFAGGRGVPRPALWILALPLGAAALRGASQAVAKVGLGIAPSPVWAALVTFAVSALVLAVIAGPARIRAALRPGPGLAWFAVAGVCNGLGLLLLNAALSGGDVVVAAPLASTAPLWTLAWGALVFGGERVTLRHVGVAALVAAGAALIVSR